MARVWIQTVTGLGDVSTWCQESGSKHWGTPEPWEPADPLSLHQEYLQRPGLKIHILSKELQAIGFWFAVKQYQGIK